MIIGIAGPYSAPTEEQRKINLNNMNNVAAKLLEMGHIPLIGMNAALPVIEKTKTGNLYEQTMAIALAVISACDGLLMIGESPGANKERDLIRQQNKPVFTSIEEFLTYAAKL